jgi:Cu/Ag efflux pump CusA
MTLGGLYVGVILAQVVDDAIVDMENVSTVASGKTSRREQLTCRQKWWCLNGSALEVRESV